jgi:DNA-binding NarL/FixJ family response regulator
MKSVRQEQKEGGDILLSDREKKVLNDLYQGLSREDIAENQYLSINTVKKVLQSLYLKLDAKNNVEAIRIAIEKNLL